MNAKTILKWVPTSVTIGIMLTALVGSLSGVFLAEVYAFVAEFNQNYTYSDVIIFGMVVVILIIFFFFVAIIGRWLKATALKELNERLKSEFLSYCIKINSKRTSENISMLVNDFKIVETNYFSLFYDTFTYFITGTVSTIYILYLNIPLGLLFIFVSFLPMLPPIIGGNYIKNQSKKWSASNASFFQSAKDFFDGMRTVKTYQAEQSVFNSTNKKMKNAEIDLEKMNFAQTFVGVIAEAISVVGELFPISIALYLVLLGHIEVGIIISMHYARDRVAFPLRTAAQYIGKMKTTSDIRAKIGKIMNEKFQKTEERKVVNKPTIEISDISFGYNDNLILNQQNLVIPYGEKLLITGKSGSGKSTFLDLLQGRLSPNEGHIFYKSENQALYAEDILQSNTIARISQEPFLFFETLEFNLTLGKKFSNSEIMEVLEQVGLVSELGEDCLEKTYGNNGSEMSGGQRQRVEIARALLHDKQVLLVDEATSSLDQVTAKKVRDILWNLPKTIIEIAHHYDEKDVKENQITHYHLENKILNIVLKN